MESIMNYENLRNFAYSNDHLIRGEIKGMVLEFFGLGGMSMFPEDNDRDRELAEQGILLLIPYGNPWAWMNPQQIAYTDELAEILFRKYNLPDSLPIVSSGGSMGGQQALVYCRYAKRTPTCCVVNCPVCDLPYHFTERPDLPRTLYSAFFHCEGNLQQAMEAASPLHLAEQLPDIPYTVFHCTADRSVNKEMHSDRFVERMKKAGKQITLIPVPDRGHCDLTPEAAEQWKACIKAGALGE